MASHNELSDHGIRGRHLVDRMGLETRARRPNRRSQSFADQSLERAAGRSLTRRPRVGRRDDLAITDRPRPQQRLQVLLWVQAVTETTTGSVVVDPPRRRGPSPGDAGARAGATLGATTRSRSAVTVPSRRAAMARVGAITRSALPEHVTARGVVARRPSGRRRCLEHDVVHRDDHGPSGAAADRHPRSLEAMGVDRDLAPDRHGLRDRRARRSGTGDSERGTRTMPAWGPRSPPSRPRGPPPEPAGHAPSSPPASAGHMDADATGRRPEELEHRQLRVGPARAGFRGLVVRLGHGRSDAGPDRRRGSAAPRAGAGPPSAHRRPSIIDCDRITAPDDDRHQCRRPRGRIDRMDSEPGTRTDGITVATIARSVGTATRRTTSPRSVQHAPDRTTRARALPPSATARSRYRPS